MVNGEKLPITVFIATKNEVINLPRCLAALERAQRVIVIDSHSKDGTAEVAKSCGAEVIQFTYRGGYPKKRQWAMDSISVETPWVLLLDADEVVTAKLLSQMKDAIAGDKEYDAFLIEKGFHFLGRRFRFGGFSHSAVMLFRTGKARFERLIDCDLDDLDMEIHERVIVDGSIGRLSAPLIHEDMKGIAAYIARHNKYSTWEARVRFSYLTSGRYGDQVITPRLLGNVQECRRALKFVAMRLPCEHWLWFGYHYLLRLGFLEGRAGLVASQLRAAYIAQVRAKVFELRLKEPKGTRPAPCGEG